MIEKIQFSGPPAKIISKNKKPRRRVAHHSAAAREEQLPRRPLPRHDPAPPFVPLPWDVERGAAHATWGGGIRRLDARGRGSRALEPRALRHRAEREPAAEGGVGGADVGRGGTDIASLLRGARRRASVVAARR